MLEDICAPALLYVVFSIIQIIIDIFKNLYNTAFLKFIVMIIFTIALNILCKLGLGVVSWMIVFIPFITMTIITTLLLFMFDLNPSTGRTNMNISYLDVDEQYRNRKQSQSSNNSRNTYLDGSISDNPMDNSWGGRKYTQHMVNSGAYKGDEILVMRN